ncbi:tRNA guanosine(34) transglycosylase Tgt [Oecophyllibacter saccharovorans]|uniref:tRNA guanosine(34) transglycosylase Tgt n=1 Tax=Oecophyllibacter saccharovorans TaxID=2558360 RepID=UPI001167B268|nr:tRNA guanosine(34) transglycosylase Tgt [Oecophyllibacter saccharovorans]TPW35046.1 tRNA guanosine(34) transglycosylase Tgt [Oecophyllibacter saccharovorans]
MTQQHDGLLSQDQALPRPDLTPSDRLYWQEEGRCGQARAGWLHTRHGRVPTPTFMPVGTVGTVKGMTADAVRATGAGVVLGNTYHLMLRPGADRVQKLGGLHRMMDWPGPILTDSGGFQVMSLGPLRKMDEDGVTFRSHIDGSSHRLTPEISTDIQFKLDATISMAFDECPALPATKERLEESMERSMRWAARSREAFTPRPGYGQFGIVQGGTEQDLRARSVKALTEIGFEGYAIGGLAVGEGQELMFSTLDFTTPLLPQDKPRYLMGVGTPDDLLGSVMRGCDMFDCVMPSRAGRTARAYTDRGPLNLRNARFAEDTRPLTPHEAGPLARTSRAYLHHLFRANEMLGPMLLTWHNLAYYQRLMRRIRAAIMNGTLEALAAQLRAGWAQGDWSPEEWPLPHYS